MTLLTGRLWTVPETPFSAVFRGLRVFNTDNQGQRGAEETLVALFLTKFPSSREPPSVWGRPCV